MRVVSLWDDNRTDWLLGTTLCAPSSHLNYELDGIAVDRLGIPLREKLAMAPAVAAYYPFIGPSARWISRFLQTKMRDSCHSPDVVHNVRMGREPLSLASFEYARERGAAFVFTPNHHPRWTGWRYRVYLDLYRRADAVIALTRAEKEVLISLGVHEDRIYVTGIGPVLADRADPARFRAQLGIDGPFVLFLGQHYPYKGYREILRATAEVWCKTPEVHFVFAGPAVGRSERIFTEVEDPRIHRVGKLDLQAKTDALAACDLLCVPSTQESFGGIYTEAWSFGKPVIGCRIPAVSEVIEDGVNGFLVDQKPSEIAAKINALLANPREAQKMGEAGRQKALNRYSWPKLTTLTLEAYRGALARKAR